MAPVAGQPLGSGSVVALEHVLGNGQIPAAQMLAQEDHDFGRLAAGLFLVPVLQRGQGVIAVIAAKGAEVVAAVVIELIRRHSHESRMAGAASKAFFRIVKVQGGAHGGMQKRPSLGEGRVPLD